MNFSAEVKLLKEKNDFVIFYDPQNKYTYPYEVRNGLDEYDDPVLVHNKEKMSEGIALIILCKLYNLHKQYYSANNLPGWIYGSPYKALLYLNLIMAVIPDNVDSIIFELMLQKEYAQAYNIYVQLDEAKMCQNAAKHHSTHSCAHNTQRAHTAHTQHTRTAHI